MSRDDSYNDRKIDFLLEAYKIRAQLYSDLTNRMWTRFNYMLTANIALFSFFLNVWLDIEKLEGAIWFPIIGIILSIIWFILGSQDRYYFEGFRIQTQEVEKELSNELKMENLENNAFGSAKGVKRDFLTQHWKFGSLSRLPALVPLLFTMIWTLVLIIVYRASGTF